jgi:hypothetical protein
MRKLMMLAAMVAVVLLVAAPAMADTVLVSRAQIDQSNEGSQYAVNLADQDASASQYQYNPGGSAATGDEFDLDINVAGNNLQDVNIQDSFQFDPSGDATGGAGGTGSQYQYQNQRQVQDAEATGPTFDADQDTSVNNRVA